MEAKHISEVIKSQLDRGALPERVKVCRPDRPAGEVLTWSESLRCYVSGITGECVWAGYVRRCWGLYFSAAAPVAHQLELVG